MINGNFGIEIPEEDDYIDFDKHFTKNFKIISDTLKNTSDGLNNKINKEDGKGLSTNDFTNEDKSNMSTNTTAITELKQSTNILSNIDFANRYYIEEAQANTPFAAENYEYIAPVEATAGIYSEPFLLPNGKYRIMVTSKNKPSNVEIAIYNPSFGCYYYDTGKDSIAFDWIKQDDKCICDFEIKTDYEQNYVMLGDGSRNMDRWNGLNVKLYRYNQSENMATKKEFNNLSDNVTANAKNITQNSDDIRNCHYFYTTVASPANIDTTNHKITIDRLVVLTMRGPSIWLDNVDLTYDTSWWIACVYFDYDETDDSKKLKICQHSDLPQKNIDIVMSFPARGAEFAKYAYAKFAFTVDGKNL